MTPPRPGGACIVDLPAGYQDDAPRHAGFGALLAAVLSDPRCGGAATRAATAGWLTRHQLGAHSSSFAYWSAAPADLMTVLDELRNTRLPSGPAGEAVLDGLRARLIAAIEGRGAAPLTLLGQLLDRAARQTPDADPRGTAGTLAVVSAADLNHAIETLLPRARVHRDHPPTPARLGAPPEQPTPRHRAGAGTTADPAPDAGWRGALEIATHPGCDARVALRLPIRPPGPDLLPLTVERLGNGPNGLLHHALRHRHHLAYGFTAAYWHEPGSSSIGATATVAPQHAAAALRVLDHTVRQLARGADPHETDLARRRCRAENLAALDGPFGAVDELRRQYLGERTIRQRLTAMAEITELPGPTFLPRPPAAAALGPFTQEHRRQLADVYQEIQ
ncbi:insulinase family protein [Streptomyces sp. NPDC046976]|uniref:insulinase family protein n=1 Tax=Streptomyces sp. NPDC046976 TaxID=3155258 RepID=UPI003400B32C